MFAVVNQYMKENQGRRYFLLPYIIVNTLTLIASIILTALLTNKFGGNIAIVATMVVIEVIGVAIKVLFVTLIAVYYVFLVRYNGF